MGFTEVKQEALKFVTPPKHEAAAVELATKTFLNKLNAALKHKRIKAKAVCGGSVAKNTWLPGLLDIDCFVRFKYSLYKDKSRNLADILEKAISDEFIHYDRLHGSRDYFHIAYGAQIFEVVPVLKIRKASKARNITDVSPLHIAWVHKKVGRSELGNEIRLAKLFLKANSIYGAESYIRGLSGYVAEILVAHYGSFLKFIKEIIGWGNKVYLDPARHYISTKTLIKALNKAKLDGPLVLVDPVQSNRNAAAALSSDKFERLKQVATKFLEAPDIRFFKKKWVTPKELARRMRGRELIILLAEPELAKKDIAGAKLLKQFKKIVKKCAENDFNILEHGWQWRGQRDIALFWIYFDPAPLSLFKKHYGPPKSADQERIRGFKEKYNEKVKLENNKYCVFLKRQYRKPFDLIKKILDLSEFQNVKLLSEDTRG